MSKAHITIGPEQPSDDFTRSYPRVDLDTARSGAVAQAGGVLLTRAAEATGLTASLRAELGRWSKPRPEPSPREPAQGMPSRRTCSRRSPIPDG